MNLLAFDTSSSACSVALQCNDQVKFIHKIAPMQHAQLILPMIQELLDEFFININQLDAITYGCGPGSFTGTRIASSVAQGLSIAAQLPIIRISSLAAMAQAAFMEHAWSPLFVAVDAHREQIYWAIYEANSAGVAELIGEEITCDPNEELYNQRVGYGIGDGFEKYAEKLAGCLGHSLAAIDTLQLPTAAAILVLAKIKLAKGDYVTPVEAVPVY